MNGRQLDALARAMAVSRSRREALRVLGAAAAAGVLALLSGRRAAAGLGCTTSDDCGECGLCLQGRCVPTDVACGRCKHCGPDLSCVQGCRQGQVCTKREGCCPIEKACGKRCCDPELTCCDGRCVAVQFDRKHCGFCNNSCQQGEACCDSACVDLKQDHQYCGNCFGPCGSDEICVNGKCCPFDRACDVCCRQGQICVVEGDKGRCCPAERACGTQNINQCCPKGARCCPGGFCVSKKQCCPTDTRCGNKCCKIGQRCADGRCVTGPEDPCEPNPCREPTPFCCTTGPNSHICNDTGCGG